MWLAHLNLQISLLAESEMTQMLDAISSIARRHSITSYDAAYVELAKRRGMPLATLDQKLKEVCLAERVSVLP